MLNYREELMPLHHLFIRVAKQCGKKLAFIDRSTDKEINYSKALIASMILAGKIGEYERGFIGIMIPTSAGAALSILGTLMSGNTPVMINYSTNARENAEYAQKKCNFKTIITSRALLEKIDCPKIDGMIYLEEIMESVTWFDKVRGGLKSKLPTTAILKLLRGQHETDTAVILFTSGSEKTPKAVQLTHQSILSNIKGFSPGFGFNTDEKMLVTLPYFHVFGLTVNLWTPLYHGMTLVTYANPIDYRTISNIVRDDKPTLMVGTPSFFWGYLKKSDPGDYKSIRVAAVGSDKCPALLRERFFEKHNVTLLEGYGTTETSPAISANIPDANKPGSVGRPLPNVQIKILNYDSGAECELNEVGKIMVNGDLVMKGYFNDLEETSLRLRSGWYDTGDMGYMDEDGYLWHAGRLKRFVKIGGEMVSLVNVEDVLVQLLPENCQCCVVDIPDVMKGSQIVAAITLDVDKQSTIKEMSKHLPNIALPRYFYIFDELPQMGSGKVDFRTTTILVQENMESKSRKTIRK